VDGNWYDTVSGDGNLYTYNRDTGIGYEFSYINSGAHPLGFYPNGTHGAGTGNIFNYANLTIHRPLGTSASSVSGIQRIPTLLTYADINSSVITHAFEGSIHSPHAHSQFDFSWPASATTWDSLYTNASFPRMGDRFRLKNTTDLSHLQSSHPAAYKVALALRDYGVFYSIRSGVDGIRINGEVGVLSDADNSALQSAIDITDFEFVDESSLMIVNTSYAAAGVPVPPGAAFSCTPLSGNTPLSVTCTDTSTNTPTSRSWAYKNATVGWTAFNTTANPVQVFYTGVYDINLTATNDDGSDDEIKTSYITVVAAGAPVASFTKSRTMIRIPGSVYFNDTSTNTTTAWNWSFGDGTYAATKNTTKKYTRPGWFTVNLTVTNAEGTDSETSKVVVTRPFWMYFLLGRMML
jgi:PKD repeat protein